MTCKNSDFLTDEDAFEILEKELKAMARRGIVFGRPESKTIDFTEVESILFGPQTDLEYRRLTKEELKDAENDDD